MNALKIATTLMREGQLAWHLLRDPRVPTLAKLIPGLALVYVLMPFDIIPDWVPIIGGVDDIAIVSGAITLFIRVCNPDIVDEIMDRIEAQ
ncbi:MAG: YkvA family protein [Chloroflexota bacterium]